MIFWLPNLSPPEGPKRLEHSILAEKFSSSWIILNIVNNSQTQRKRYIEETVSVPRGWVSYETLIAKDRILEEKDNQWAEGYCLFPRSPVFFVESQIMLTLSG